jgi:hypothetical protein
LSELVFPRFTVGSVTGYPYMQRGSHYIGSIGGDRRKPRETWHVYDRLYCCQLLGTHDGPGAEERARHSARRKNGEYARWLRLNGLR